jgi:phosphatidate cytidylyltransferase
VKRVLTAVILIPIVVLALFRAPLWLFTLLVLGVALLAAREYFGIAEKSGYRPFDAIGYLFLGCEFGFVVFMSVYMERHLEVRQFGMLMGFGLTAVFLLPLAAPFLLLVGGTKRAQLSGILPDAGITFLLYPYIGGTLVCLPLLRFFPNGATYLLFLMLLVWCGDIGAYYVGRAIGKHKLAPRISPGKSWEGSIASVVGAVIVGILLFRFVNPITQAFRSAHLLVQSSFRSSVLEASVPDHVPVAPIWFVALFAICVNVAAQLGDLVESALKRGAGMKDSGTLLPGHGGVLDRIDALLFALPVGLLFYFLGMSRYFEPSGIR